MRAQTSFELGKLALRAAKALSKRLGPCKLSTRKVARGALWRIPKVLFFEGYEREAIRLLVGEVAALKLRRFVRMPVPFGVTAAAVAEHGGICVRACAEWHFVRDTARVQLAVMGRE